MDARALPGRLARSRWPGLAVTVLVLAAWAAFLGRQLDELRHYPWQITPLAFGSALLFGALYFGGLAWCWGLLLRSVSRAAAGVSPWAAARVWLLSMMTRYIPGNVWHILSRVAFAGKLGVPKTHILTSATIEQMLTILGALALVGLTLPFWGVAPGVEGWFLLLLPLGLIMMHPLILGVIMAWGAVRLKRPELAWDYTYGQILLLVVAYAGANLCAALSLYAILWGLTPVNPVQLPLVIGSSALAWVVGYLSFLTPSGLGVREAILTALLAQVYPLPVAIIGSLLFRLAATLGESGAALLAWGYTRMYEHDQQVTSDQ